MFRFACIAAVMTLGATVASAETWNVSEGAGLMVRGTWNVTVAGPSVSGNATMSGNGQKLTYGLVGSRKDGGYVIQRVRSSDGAACTYVGKPGDAGTIQGSAICNGASRPWTVTRAN